MYQFLLKESSRIVDFFLCVMYSQISFTYNSENSKTNIIKGGAKMSINAIINRQYAIANNQADPIDLPKQRIYAMCNLRGGNWKNNIIF